jgi:hypothetical protein
VRRLTVKAPGSNFESASERPIDTRRTTSSEASFQKIWALESVKIQINIMNGTTVKLKFP